MNADAAPPLSRAWLVVALLWFVALFNYLDRIMLTTMRGSLMDAIPMTDAQFGLLTSVFLWVYGLLSPFAGFLADRFSRSRVIVGSLFAWSLITWLTAHAANFEQLLVTRALMGISEACYIPAALALIADYHRGRTRSLATGVHMTGIMVGAGLGGMGGWLAERHDWSYPFSFFGMIGIAYGGLLFFLLRDVPRGPGAGPPKLKMSLNADFGAALVSLFSRRAFILAFAFWGVLGIVGWAVTGWMPTYLKEHFHLGQGVAGLSATGYLQAASLVGVLIGGAWADRWSASNPRGRILVPVIGLCVAAPGVLLAANTTVLGVALLGLVVFGLARAFSDANMMPILCLIADPRYRATGYGVLNMFACIVGGLAIYAGGALRDAHVDLSRIFQFAAVSMLVCIALLFSVRPVANAEDRPD
jgi:MFS family permease